MKLSHCIGCACHDRAACYDQKSDGPCSWLAVDRREGLGVCSACPDALTRWNADDHSMGVPIEGDQTPRGHDAGVDALQILESLDVPAFCAATACPRDNALNALHKVRYEHADVPAEMRHASRDWLQAHGHDRIHGLQWPPLGTLPGARPE